MILGGLFISTALTLLVLPTLALRFARFLPEGLDTVITQPLSVSS